MSKTLMRMTRSLQYFLEIYEINRLKICEISQNFDGISYLSYFPMKQFYSVLGADRADLSTWTAKGGRSWPGGSRGVSWKNRAGQCAGAWVVRGARGVQRAFAVQLLKSTVT